MYHKFQDEDGTEFGSFETLFVSAKECEEESKINPGNPIWNGEGWYWWSCIPGCLPDSEPFGPFDSEEEAVKSAQELQ